MAFGTWTDGNSLGATDVNTKIVQAVYIDKPIDETVTSSVTIQNDDHLKFAAVANTNYWVKGHILVTGENSTSSGGIQFGWYAPSGATFHWCSDAPGSGAEADTDGIAQVSRRAQGVSNLPDLSTIGTGSPLIISFRGVFRIGATAGTCGFRWAQASSSATTTRVMALSAILVQKLI